MAIDSSSGASRVPRARTGKRSAAQIESDLEAARTRLSASIEELIDQVHPQRVKQRLIGRVQALVQEKKIQAKSLVIDEYGDVRVTRLALVGGGIVGFVGFVAALKAIVARGKR
ncbi:MAG: DUF3618 domain-containing protein [Propionibacteriaceae bacterium]